MEVKYLIIGILVNVLLVFYGKNTLSNKKKIIRNSEGFYLVKNSFIDIILATILIIISIIFMLFVIFYIPKNHWFIIFATLISLLSLYIGVVLIYLYKSASLKYNDEIIISNQSIYLIDDITEINPTRKLLINGYDVKFKDRKSIHISSISQGSTVLISKLKKSI